MPDPAVKLCKDCKHAERIFYKTICVEALPDIVYSSVPLDITDDARCLHTKAHWDDSLVTGKPILHTAGWMREPGHECDTEGKLWEKADAVHK